jgi:acyl carrier protein
MIAYYVSRQEVDSAELHEFLVDSIIEETIPNVFVHLKKLPLTLNGKLNLRALPTLDEVKQRAQHTYVAPRNRIEEQLAEIWKQVFGVERVGIHDNFFELGGHSLIATQVIGRVRQMLHTELLVRSVFEAPTIAELAAAIEKLEQQPQTNHTKIGRRIDAQRAGDLLSKVDELSESELDTLLGEMLAEEKVSE